MFKVNYPVVLIVLAIFGLITISGCATPVSTAETKATSAMAEARKATAHDWPNRKKAVAYALAFSQRILPLHVRFHESSRTVSY